jgi:hypothetical protein
LVPATIQREWMTAASDWYGTHHTTHFDVAFFTATGVPVHTVVNANGEYKLLPAGAGIGAAARSARGVTSG